MGLKCCKSRSSSYYVCKYCFQIFHKSCLLRMSKNKIQYFADNIINCCLKEENENEIHKEKSSMEETILELEEDNSLKTKHIEILKKNNSLLLQEAIETENDLRNMISCQEKETENLRIEMDKALKKLRESENKEVVFVSTQTFTNTSDSYIQTHESSFSTYNSVYTQTCNKPFQSDKIDSANENRQNEEETIISLDDESTPYLEISADEQYLMLNQSIAETEDVGQQHQDQLKGDEKRVSESKCKILITGDEYARNFARILDLVMDTSNQIIDEVIEPKSELSDITKNLFSKVLNYDSNDFVIIMFNTKNVSNNASLRYALKNILPISKFTNLIVMSEINQNLDQILINTFARRINQFKKLNRNHSLNFFVDEKVKGSKFNLVKEIEIIMKCPRTSRIVLKSVNVGEKVSENFFRH